jgi:hypothetical protein
MTQPNHRPERQVFIIHAEAAAEPATLPEWWGAIDSGFESRSLRFAADDANWLDEGDLPQTLTAAGCRLSEVMGVGDYPGLAQPSLEVGHRVLLQPEGRESIAVWTEDASQQVGYLAGNVAAETMAESQRRGTGYAAFVAAEQRDSGSHERRGLTVLLGPGAVWAEKAS